MSRQANTDVLVVGAGPVGMLTAMLLTEAGVRVTLIDRERRPATHSYACGLHPRSLKLLKQLGLLVDVSEQARRIDKVAFYSGKGREAEVKLSVLPAEFPYVLVFPQSALELLMAERLEKAGCEVLWHHRLSTLHPTPAGVVAEIDQLVGTSTGYIVPHWEWVVKRTIQTTATFVVGTDGAHSLVRRLLGIEHERVADPEYYVAYEFESEAKLDDELRVVVDRGAKSVLWPLAANRCRWSFQLPDVDGAAEFGEKDRSPVWGESASVSERTLDRLRKRLEARAPWFNADVKKMDWAVDIQFQHRVARQFGRDRCWLAGDAAHQTGPAAIQSMNVGLLEAEDLAGILSRILRNGASVDLLQGYARTHRDEWMQLLGAKGAPVPGPGVNPWINENRGRILSAFPASGQDLAALLAQLKLTLP